MRLPPIPHDIDRSPASVTGREKYSWDAVTDAYEGLLSKLAG
jgi:hypothetical protein